MLNWWCITQPTGNKRLKYREFLSLLGFNVRFSLVIYRNSLILLRLKTEILPNSKYGDFLKIKTENVTKGAHKQPQNITKGVYKQLQNVTKGAHKQPQNVTKGAHK